MSRMLRQPVHSFTIGDTPLLATFDQQAALIRLFNASVDGQALTFNKIDQQRMQDEQTGSSWSINNAQAIDGELQGKQLTPRVGIMSFDRAWRNFHPVSKMVAF